MNPNYLNIICHDNIKVFLLVIVLALTLGVRNGVAKERNLLTKDYFVNDLKKDLVIDKTWIEYPSYYNRAQWDVIDEEKKNVLIELAESLMEYDWPTITATDFLEFERKGSRQGFERKYKKRIYALKVLVAAELVEGKQRFLDQIINGVWSFCEQTYWGLSAHVRLQPTGRGLPNIEDLTIDLGTGTVGALLAWTNYFLEDEFNKTNEFISQRIKYEITEKILKPYYNREDMWWMGYSGGMVNNWNPWVNSNVLACLLLVETDADQKAEGIYKVMTSLDKFINYYHDDGGCDEGPTYWQHAGGKMYQALDLLYSATEGKINIFENEVIRNIGNYIYKVYIGDNYYINFADSYKYVSLPPHLIYKIGMRSNDTIMQEFGAFLLQNERYNMSFISTPLNMMLTRLFNERKLFAMEGNEPLISDFYLEETEIVGARSNNNSSDGFFFAAKGGHNKESHNHNDVGSFILYSNAKPLLVDAGVGTYTKKTFSSERYELWNVQSSFHNLPTINNTMQMNGIEYRSSNVSCNLERDSVTFKLDISKAYPKEAKVNKWFRTFSFCRKKGLTITEDFELSEVNSPAVLNYLTPSEVDIDAIGIIEFEDNDEVILMYDPQLVTASYHEVEITDGRLEHSWSSGLRRIQLRLKGSAQHEKVIVNIVKREE